MPMKNNQLTNKINPTHLNDLRQKATQNRLLIAEMLTNAKSSHVGCAYSVIDILTVLYHSIVNPVLIKEQSSTRDYIILSKGHAASALYAALMTADIIPLELRNTYGKIGSQLAGHPMKGILPGVEASTGSLGHGLSLGVGVALSLKNDRKKNRVFVIMGDGECQEGAIWEAITLASRYALNNLKIIIDYNKLQGFDRTDDLVPQKFAPKFKAFGCSTTEINGHDYAALVQTLSQKTKKPHLIIAHTIKGKGVSFIEDKLEWHYKSFNQEQYQQAKKELELICEPSL